MNIFKKGIASKKEKTKTLERFFPLSSNGLSQAQVAQRKIEKLVNKKANTNVKSPLVIIWNNLFSFFNILLYVIGLALIIVKAYSSLFFLGILFINIAIGMFQDFRARKTLMNLLIINAHQALVIREGKEVSLKSYELVLDDVVKVKLGDQILADGIILEGTVGVNESLLTGESDIIHKSKGETILLGSFVTTGTALYQVDKVGKDGYAQTIQLKARTFKRPKSELLDSIQRLFQIIGIIVILMGILLIFATLYQKNEGANAVTSIAGSLVGMIPSGMVLLTSMTLAVGVIRLGKKDTLVNEMYSIEMLARIDVLCLDKTGTITDGTMNVHDIIVLDQNSQENINQIMVSLLEATQDENPTARALRKHFNGAPVIKASNVLPFSSDNKYSGATFGGQTYFIGATNMLLEKADAQVMNKREQDYLKRGFRTLTLAVTSEAINGKTKPEGLKPVALIVIQDTIRKEAINAITWFKEHGVKVKVISGDDPVSVSEIAKQVGIEHSDKYLDLSKTSLASLSQEDDITVFGRVKPDEKETIIRSLQEKGHTVAMIGDGVNDVLALKSADCSIAMGKGSGAARGVSHLALLNDNFDALPSIVVEGRRAINNLQKTWALFLVKTTFAVVLTFIFLLAAFIGPAGSHIRYPLEPKNMYIWEILALGQPSFFLSLQPNRSKIEGTFFNNVMRRSIPAGLVISLSVALIYGLQFLNVFDINAEAAKTMVILTFTFLSFVVLYRNSRPFNKFRTIMFVTLSVLAVIVMAALHILYVTRGTDLLGAHYKELSAINIIQVVLITLVATAGYVLLDHKLSSPKKRIVQNES